MSQVNNKVTIFKAESEITDFSFNPVGAKVALAIQSEGIRIIKTENVNSDYTLKIEDPDSDINHVKWISIQTED